MFRLGMRPSRVCPGLPGEEDAIDGVCRAWVGVDVAVAKEAREPIDPPGCFCFRIGSGLPFSKSGSSLGEGGGGGKERSISGGSFLMVRTSFLEFLDDMDFRLLDFVILSGE